MTITKIYKKHRLVPRYNRFIRTNRFRYFNNAGGEYIGLLTNSSVDLNSNGKREMKMKLLAGLLGGMFLFEILSIAGVALPLLVPQ